MAEGNGIKIVARNRRARYDYNIEESLEAGIVLQGTEVKACREGRINLRDAYAMVENGEVFVYNLHISHYSHGNRENHEPRRRRKLLLHRREIEYLHRQVRETGYTLIPLKAYFKHGLLKVELALAKGKKKYDKRREIAEREAERRMRQAERKRYRNEA